MRNVTVPGASYSASYTGECMVQSAEIALITAVEIAAALELEAYAAFRKAFHRHQRDNNAMSAGVHDAAVHAWHEAQEVRDHAEKRRSHAT